MSASTTIGMHDSRIMPVSNGYRCTVVTTADDGVTLGQVELVGNTYSDTLDALRTYLDARVPGTEWSGG